MFVSSRIARKPVSIPTGVDISLSGSDLVIKGPKGQMQIMVPDTLEIAIENKELRVSLAVPKTTIRRKAVFARQQKALAGTMRANVANLVIGVSKGFERKLTLVGVGYRATLKGRDLNLSLGFSHPVILKTPEGIVIETPSQTEILVKGTDKHLVGYVASIIRAKRPPEVYKGKGVRYAEEIIELKETKKK